MRILFAAPLALLFASSSALAQAPAWRVSETSGDVRILENGQVHPAARGAIVPGGAVVTTGAASRAVLVRAHDYGVVSPASRVRVPTLQQQGGSGLFQMITDAGTALFRVQHTSVPHFGVRTPYLAAVVKGTVFTVTVGERGASVQVTEGAVQVSTVDGGAADMVRPGMVASIGAADLQLLHIEGGTSHDLRSNGSPSAGVVTVPATEAGHYEGPADSRASVAHDVHEDPVSLADATGGLIAGNVGGERVLAETHDVVRAGTRGGTDNNGNAAGHDGGGSANAGGGNNSGSGKGGGGNGNAGSGNNSGSGSGNAGNGNGNSGSGNNSGNGNAGNGNNSGGGSGNGGGGNGNAGSGNNSGNGSGNAGNGNGNSGSGNNSGNGNGGNGGSGSDNSGSGNNSGGGSGGSGSDNSGSGNNSGGGSGSGGGGSGSSGSDNSGGGNGSNSGNGNGGVTVCVADLACVGVGSGRRPHP